MTISFNGEYVSFWTRLIKKLSPIVLILAVLFLKIKYGRTFSGNYAAYKIYFYIFGVVCFLIGLYYHIRDIRTVVTEVRIFDDKFQVLGFDFNSKFDDTLNINEILFELKEKEKTKQPYIEIYSNDKYYYINSYSDWKKETLAKLICEYKTRSGKTIFGIEAFPELIPKN
jgi:hypothetical protein